MAIKLILSFFVVTSTVVAQDKIEFKEHGRENKIFVIENEVMLHNDGVIPTRVRTNLRGARRIGQDDKVSEIFADTEDGSGRLRSLPGGIIIELKEGVDGNQWASHKGYKILRELSNNQFMISSSPGRKTLEEMDAVREDNDVKSVKANWWTNIGPKKAVDASQFKRTESFKFNRD